MSKKDRWGNLHRRVYQEALGIHTGDIVTTIHDTYEVWAIEGPWYWFDEIHPVIWPCPVITLLLVAPGHMPNWAEECPFSIVNELRHESGPVDDQEGDRWFDDQNDEVIVQRPATPPALPIDMFRSYPTPILYPWQPGVDYAAAQRQETQLWHCRRCGHNFTQHITNATNAIPGCQICPSCGGLWAYRGFIMQPHLGMSSYQVAHQMPPAWFAWRKQPDFSKSRIEGEIVIPGSAAPASAMAVARP